MNYKTSDIIKRARQLADLENSSFISWNENFNLLREAYTKLYTEIINHADKSYFKTVLLSDLGKVESNDEEVNLYALPEDFYFLQGVVTDNGNTPVLRRAETESKHERRYDLINNNLAIYGRADSEVLYINYFPVPETLYLRAPNKSISLPTASAYLDVNGNRFLGFDSTGEGHNFFVYNLENGAGVTVTIAGLTSVTWGILGNKTAVIYADDTLYYINLVSQTYTTSANYAMKSNGLIYKVEVEDGVLSLYKENSASVYAEVTVELPDGYSNNSVWTCNSDMTEIYIPVSNVLYKCTVDGSEALFEVADDTSSRYMGSNLYAVSGDGAIIKNNEVLRASDDYWEFLGFSKEDERTGYGFITKNEAGEYEVMSVYSDTVLTFPNNFYFQYLAYMLAISYKAKQNADSSSLEAQAEKESFQFYNSVARDVNQDVRIKNVYARGGRW